ncbi:MAG: hypothetical protein IBJ16_13155 [Chitinophagaceae bacterium]|nr:hypothetical protein [Chitinophagaceae bacterium]
MKRFIATACLALLVSIVTAQTVSTKKANQFVDLALTAGTSQGSAALSYVHNWKIGKKQKWEIGIGGRLTSYFGTKRDFITAGPARLTRSQGIPFLIFFADQKPENWDTLNVQRPFTTALNTSINIGYSFNKKWSAGFNIDVIGVTLGRTTNGILTSNGTTRNDPKVKPTAFNILLTGDHDRGSLNSEFFVGYKLSDKWSLRGVYQFYFSEYKTTTLNQVASDGTVINRFRNKVNAFGIGISRHF